jgi:hypothetical protein
MQFSMQKAKAAFEPIIPEGISLTAVRGLRASMLRSAQRLKLMAALRANTMQSSTFSANEKERASGACRIASKNPVAANGRANRVCENLTRER